MLALQEGPITRERLRWDCGETRWQARQNGLRLLSSMLDQRTDWLRRWGVSQVLPGAGNIIPGKVRASLDVRHWSDKQRTAAVRELCEQAKQIASRRGLGTDVKERMNQRAVMMDEHLVNCIEQGMRTLGEAPRRMVSGAGHDAMIMAEQVPSAIVFLRSPGGISHHPDESVRAEDVEKAIRLGVAILADLAAEMELKQ